MKEFEIKCETLLEAREALDRINEKIKECYLKHINLTIDFGDKKVIPGIFKLNLNCNFDLTIKGDKLTHIGDNFLNRCEELTKIILPPNIISFGDYFLRECIFLKEIKLPENLEYVGIWFMDNCKSLTNITLPKNLEYMGDYFLCNTYFLTQIIAPEHIKLELDKVRMTYTKPKIIISSELEKD